MAFSSLPLTLIIPFLFFYSSHSQQPYINNVQLNCYATNASGALGYSCNGDQPSCSSYLTFRSQPLYNSPALIAFLLSADTANISSINSVSDVAPLPAGELILVPISCSCSNRLYYQHNASHTIQTLDETYLTVANDTYQGLSTCQALIDQNPFGSRNLSLGDKLVVPLRCACPTVNQTSGGIKFLVSYLIIPGDNIPTIAQTFGADYQSVLRSNELNEKSTIFPYTTLLIPLSAAPTKLSFPAPPPPTTSNAPPPATSAGGGGSGHTGLYAGVGVGAALVLLVFALALFFCLRRRRARADADQRKIKEPVSVTTEYEDLPFKPNSFTSQTTASQFSPRMRDALDWMTAYRFEELQKATGDFDEEHRIGGSVYRGIINGDTAAIKQLEGNVSSEINILKQISHSSLIRLSGFCLHEGNTYIVYEFADRGSLSDCLRSNKTTIDSIHLTWKQRIQIACDVADGLSYLHDYTNPPYIHKNMKSSNVLITKDFRAKVSNFALARPAVDEGATQEVTRHVMGTQGYLAPEYLERGLVTPKLDVFAFGVVLLELLSGKEATVARGGGEKGEVFLSSVIADVLHGHDARSKLRDFVDPCLRNGYPFDLAFAVAELAMRCVSPDPNLRPVMNELVISLSAIYNSSLDWDPEDEKLFSS